MKRYLALLLGVCLGTSSALAAVDGSWSAKLDSKRPGRIHLSLTSGSTRNMGSSRDITELAGLSNTVVSSTTPVAARFALRREAGTVSFEGTFQEGRGSGNFTFAPNLGALDAIRGLGVDVATKKQRSAEETLFTLALFDVSTTFIRTMMAEGYRVSLDQYVAMRIFDITPEYVREMRALGFKEIDDDELIATRIHGVTPQYVREARAAGWDLDLDELLATRIHGATPEFAAEMKRLGYDLSQKDLVSFRIHRVNEKFIEDMRKLGYTSLTAKQLIKLRIHGVTPNWVEELERAGYEKIPVDKLVAMKIHGIDGDQLKKLAR